MEPAWSWTPRLLHGATLSLSPIGCTTASWLVRVCRVRSNRAGTETLPRNRIHWVQSCHSQQSWSGKGDPSGKILRHVLATLPPDLLPINYILLAQSISALDRRAHLLRHPQRVRRNLLLLLHIRTLELLQGYWISLRWKGGFCDE